MKGSLTLVSAPAGFGKTALVSSWLSNSSPDQSAEQGFFSAWLTVDESDSDVFTFVRYLIASLQEIFPEACNQTREMIQNLQGRPMEMVLAMLCNELNLIKNHFVLVLDDYHSIKGEEVHHLIAEILQTSPEYMHIILIARRNPPLPLSSLRVKGLLTEIRVKDLRFARDEMDALISQELAVCLSEKELATLDEQIEGWVAGLRLLILALRDQGHAADRLLSLAENSSGISDYLVDEVLSRQLPAIQTFLLRTSILDQFCIPLCDAIMTEYDPAWSPSACLEWIVKDDLLISSFGQDFEWFAYHRLLRDVLRRKLAAEYSTEKIKELHRKAAEWHRDNGYTDEALKHALSAGDLDLAATVIENGLRVTLNQDDRQSLERWLRVIPDEMIASHPGLLILKAWAAQFEWQLDAQASLLDQIENLMTEEKLRGLSSESIKILRGQVMTMRGQKAYINSQPVQALAFLREAYELVPNSWIYLRGGILLYMSLSLLADGQVEEAISFSTQESMNITSDPFLRSSMGLCFIYLNTGRIDELKGTAEIMRTQAVGRNLIILATWAWLYLGTAAYLQNDLNLATIYFQEVARRRYVAQALAVKDGMTGLALIHQAKGEISEAFRMVDTLIQFDLEQTGIESNRSQSLRARLWYLNGDKLKSNHWVESIREMPQASPLTWLEEPQLTLAFILVNTGKLSNEVRAVRILEKLEVDARDLHNYRYLAQVLAQKALALAVQKKRKESQAALRQALELSVSGNLLRVFIDLGPQMRMLLVQFRGKASLTPFIKTILAGFDQNHTSSQGVNERVEKDRNSNADSSKMVESLTPREMELLALMREPINNKQIANRLGLSYATIKRYSINLYAKMDVNNRWEAVAKGIETGLLPQRNP